MYLEFKVNSRHIGEGSGDTDRNSLLSNGQLSCVEKKIVLETREREGMKEIGKGAKAPYKTLGFITIVEGCRDKARRESKGFRDQYHAFIHLPPASSIFDLRPFLTLVGNATRQGERSGKSERER